MRSAFTAAILFVAACGSCYSAAFHAWLTATPLSSEQLAAHQRYFYCWFAAAVVTCLAGVGVLIWRHASKRTRSI